MSKVPLGKTVITPNAQSQLGQEDILGGLRRHSAGDWGTVCPDDWQANEGALQKGTRLFSVYDSRGGVKFWIITEADRNSTTILMPEDY